MDNMFSFGTIVSYSDVDKNNQITNKGILKLLQDTAQQHVESFGYGIKDIPKTGMAWIILNWKLKILKRPQCNETLKVNTWANTKKSLYFYRNFEIYDELNNLVAIATSKWIIFDVNKKKISKINEDLENKSSKEIKNLFDDNFNESLKEPLNSKLVTEYKVQRRDIDTNNHVNNLCYLDFAEEALPFDIYNNINFSNVEIMYKHEAKLGNTLLFFYSNNDLTHTITIKDKNDNKLHAVIKFSL